MDAESGRDLAARLGRRWAVIEVTSAVAGALVLSTFVRVLHGGGPIADPHTMVLLVYLAVVLPLGWAWRQRRLRAMWQWLREDRDPT